MVGMTQTLLDSSTATWWFSQIPAMRQCENHMIASSNAELLVEKPGRNQWVDVLTMVMWTISLTFGDWSSAWHMIEKNFLF